MWTSCADIFRPFEKHKFQNHNWHVLCKNYIEILFFMHINKIYKILNFKSN
jgi:hypothetical protein